MTSGMSGAAGASIARNKKGHLFGLGLEKVSVLSSELSAHCAQAIAEAVFAIDPDDCFLRCIVSRICCRQGIVEILLPCS